MQLQEAADALGVHYQTAYGWVRQGLLPARKVGRGYEVTAGDVRALAAQREAGREPARLIHVRDYSAQADRLYSAIVAGEETRARQGLARLAGGVPLIDLCQQILGPALRRMGDGWASGQVSIAREHRASAICERLLAAYTHQPPGRPRGTAVVATPPGERHSLPALMAAACLREDRWLVHHLATDLPVAQVSQLALDVGADLIVLSCATSQAGHAAVTAAGGISAAHPDLVVLVGQPADSLHDLRRQARLTRAPEPGPP